MPAPERGVGSPTHEGRGPTVGEHNPNADAEYGADSFTIANTVLMV